MIDPTAFAHEKLNQLAAAMADPVWKSAVPHLLDQLAQVGVMVTGKQDYQDSRD